MQFALYVHPAGHVQANARNPKGETLVYQTFWQDGARRLQPMQTRVFKSEGERRGFTRETRERGYTKVCTFATRCTRADSNETALRNLLALLDRTRARDDFPRDTRLHIWRAVNAMYSFLLDPKHFPYSGLVLFQGQEPSSPRFNF